MTYRAENSAFQTAMELIHNVGFDGMGEAFQILLNEAMKQERCHHLQAEPYERHEGRQGYANGYKAKTINTRVGKLELAVPQVRDSSFYPQSLERGLRSERALKLALAEMYVQGVSTRKVAAITETLCGFEVSSTQVSQAAKALDEHLQQWRERPLKAYRYLYLDARYEKVRQGGCVVDCAVLTAIGIDEQGKREILGVSVALSEHEVHWRTFLQSLTERGLHGMQLITSDAHAGLKAARRAVFPSIPWQRCQFHLQQNAQAHVPKQSLKKQVANELRSVLTAPSRAEADRLLNMVVTSYEKEAPLLAKWMAENVPESLTVFDFPEEHRRRLRTSNVVERVNKEIKRRTRVATLFPNPGSCERLVTAVLMELNDDWQTGIAYLTM